MALAARHIETMETLNIDFDCDEDVLYVSVGAPVPSYVDEGESGLLFRRANIDNRPSGVTAIDFRQNWLYDRPRFYSVVADHLAIPVDDVARAVERAL
jgi:hypothetical protein